MAPPPPSSSSSTTDAEQRDSLQVFGVDDADADAVLSAVSSEMARSLLMSLYEQSGTPSELAERIDTSVSNVLYHLEKLDTAGLIEITETKYSTKGREMNVYAPAEHPVVLFVGQPTRKATFFDAVKRLVGATGILFIASFLLYLSGSVGRAGAGGQFGSLLDLPAVTFFLGGMFLLVVFILWRIRQHWWPPESAS